MMGTDVDITLTKQGTENGPEHTVALARSLFHGDQIQQVLLVTPPHFAFHYRPAV